MNPAWNLVGRVHFNLAENRRDPDYPFRLHGNLHDASFRRRPRPNTFHWVRPCATTPGAVNKSKLLSLLVPIQRAVETCAWLPAHGGCW